MLKELKKEESLLRSVDDKEREVLRLCSAAIKHLHNKELNKAKKLLKKAEKIIKNTNWGFRTIAYQEYVEAYSFYNVEVKGEVLKFPFLSIPARAFLNGTLDLIGELKRAFLSSLIRGERKRAYFYSTIMLDIYDSLSLIVVDNRVVPEFRRKLDIARIQVDQVLSLLSSKMD